MKYELIKARTRLLSERMETGGMTEAMLREYAKLICSTYAYVRRRYVARGHVVL
jgi:hypothetical protein